MTCEICGRLGCRNCIHLEWDNGDYPISVTCKECWDIGEPFRKRKQELEEELWDEIDKLNDEWKRLAIKNKEVMK